MSEIKTWWERMAFGADDLKADYMQQEINELRSALAEAEKDASRYRAIKASSWYVGPGDFWCSVEGELQDACDHNERDNSLDIAVDLAITTGDWSV